MALRFWCCIRFAKFLGILTLESFTAAALGLSVGAAAPSTDAAVAIGPAVMLVWIIFGGFYCNSENIPRCGFRMGLQGKLAHYAWAGCAAAAAAFGFERWLCRTLTSIHQKLLRQLKLQNKTCVDSRSASSSFVVQTRVTDCVSWSVKALSIIEGL